MTTRDLSSSEFAPFFVKYIALVDEDIDLRQQMMHSGQDVADFFSGIEHVKGDFRYAVGKWSIKEVFQHMIDTERIFAYRLFRIGRGDDTPLSGFNQDLYNLHAGVEEKSMIHLMEEFKVTREYTQVILEGFSDTNLAYIGTSSGHPLSARAAAFIIIGHAEWHMNKIRDLYLS